MSRYCLKHGGMSSGQCDTCTEEQLAIQKLSDTIDQQQSDFCPHGLQLKFYCVQCSDEQVAARTQSSLVWCEHGIKGPCKYCEDEPLTQKQMQAALGTKPFVKDSQITPKTMVSLIPPDFVLGLSDVLSYGAGRYGRDNWKTCPQEDLYLYKDAMLRHVYAWLGGEKTDSDTGLSHLHHAAVNMAFLLDFENKGEGDET